MIWLLPPLQSARCLYFCLPVFRQSNLLSRERGRGGGGAEWYDDEKAWPSINHSILSGNGFIFRRFSTKIDRLRCRADLSPLYAYLRLCNSSVYHKAESVISFQKSGQTDPPLLIRAPLHTVERLDLPTVLLGEANFWRGEGGWLGG